MRSKHLEVGGTHNNGCKSAFGNTFVTELCISDVMTEQGHSLNNLIPNLKSNNIGNTGCIVYFHFNIGNWMQFFLF